MNGEYQTPPHLKTLIDTQKLIVSKKINNFSKEPLGSLEPVLLG